MSALPGQTKTGEVALKKGDVIAGKYQIEDVLGAGGMGVVVSAVHVALRQRVAIKFLLPQAASVPEATARFLREARAAAAIQSEHVARVLDVGTLDSGAPYMVMEFLAGTDLGALVKDRGPLPIQDAVDFVLQAGEAIAEAHTLGIVHRDLKPANLFLTTRAEGSPLVKVLDFGLSKMPATDDGASEGSLTATGFVMGSPQYMSPEQIRSLKDVDSRTDLWALGVILYELLTGKRPFDAPSLTAVAASIVSDAPKPVRSLRAAVPEVLDRAVMRCLEKDTSRRCQNVGELAQALALLASEHSWPSVDRIQRLQAGSGGTQAKRSMLASRPDAHVTPGILPTKAAVADPAKPSIPVKPIPPRPKPPKPVIPASSAQTDLGAAPPAPPAGMAASSPVVQKALPPAALRADAAPIAVRTAAREQAPETPVASPPLTTGEGARDPRPALPAPPIVLASQMLPDASTIEVDLTTMQASSWGQTGPVVRSRPVALIAVICVLAATLALASVVWVMRSDASGNAAALAASESASASAVTIQEHPIPAPTPISAVTVAPTSHVTASAPQSPKGAPPAAKTAAPAGAAPKKRSPLDRSD